MLLIHKCMISLKGNNIYAILIFFFWDLADGFWMWWSWQLAQECVCYSPKGQLLAVATQHTSVQRNNKCVSLHKSGTGKLSFKPQGI